MPWLNSCGECAESHWGVNPELGKDRLQPLTLGQIRSMEYTNHRNSYQSTTERYMYLNLFNYDHFDHGSSSDTMPVLT